jgi:prolyl-tRNA editing enzyme YbaK/EbsC (Cys-tRNA(Pro) deacylase)
MEQNYEEPVSRVKDSLAKSNLPIELVSLSQTTATAVQAAETLGVEVDQIGKSIAVGTAESLYIVLLRGTAKVSIEKLRSITGAQVKILDRDVVHQRTGFKVGGVSPIGSIEAATVFMDQGLFNFSQVWVAGGSPYSVFGCSPENLHKLTNAEVCDVIV